MVQLVRFLPRTARYHFKDEVKGKPTESFMRVRSVGSRCKQTIVFLPPVISHGSVAKLIGVRTKESNQDGLELQS